MRDRHKALAGRFSVALATVLVLTGLVLRSSHNVRIGGRGDESATRAASR